MMAIRALVPGRGVGVILLSTNTNPPGSLALSLAPAHVHLDRPVAAPNRVVHIKHKENGHRAATPAPSFLPLLADDGSDAADGKARVAEEDAGYANDESGLRHHRRVFVTRVSRRKLRNRSVGRSASNMERVVRSVSALLALRSCRRRAP
ncbi:hypothetical protein EDB85DRAFT_1972697 [Lactarius pseudohatsudake]|nr:hypothetical protein EDB85DRAFT_1972697 [Lactarius pseudohatsudake]